MADYFLEKEGIIFAALVFWRVIDELLTVQCILLIRRSAQYLSSCKEADGCMQYSLTCLIWKGLHLALSLSHKNIKNAGYGENIPV